MILKKSFEGVESCWWGPVAVRWVHYGQLLGLIWTLCRRLFWVSFLGFSGGNWWVKIYKLSYTFDQFWFFLTFVPMIGHSAVCSAALACAWSAIWVMKTRTENLIKFHVSPRPIKILMLCQNINIVHSHHKLLPCHVTSGRGIKSKLNNILQLFPTKSAKFSKV